MYEFSGDQASGARVSLIEVAVGSLIVGSMGLVFLDKEALAVATGLAGLGLAVLSVGRRLADLVESGRERPFSEEDRDRAVVSALQRIAEALESSEQVRQPSAGPDSLTEIREAIREGRWDEVEARIESLRAGGGFPPEFQAEVDRHRESAEADLRARLDASRQANDAVSVLTYRTRLLPMLAEESRRQVDADLIRWFMGLLMKRMRAGTVRADVAELAEAIAEAFPTTTEGASLRASLSTLRRSAGLCPRCAAPYVGEDDACPKCLGKVIAAVAAEEQEAPDDDLPAVERDPEDDPFLPRE